MLLDWKNGSTKIFKFKFSVGTSIFNEELDDAAEELEDEDVPHPETISKIVERLSISFLFKVFTFPLTNCKIKKWTIV